MKSSISYIISFILMIFISSLISFIVVEISLRSNSMFNILDKVNYYDDAYKNITHRINEYIVNDDIKNEYIDFITKKMIKNDIKNIINNSEYKVSYYDEFYIIISGYSDDEHIRNKYASDINKIYVSNIFPIREYKLLDKLYINNEDIIIYSLILGIIILLFNFILFAINKSFKYNFISIISGFMLICFPFIFINVMNLFGNFIYTNSYYTNYLIGLIDSIKNSLFIIGISLLLIILIMNVKLSVKKDAK